MNQDTLQQVNKCGSSIMEYYNLEITKKCYQKPNQHGIQLSSVQLPSHVLLFAIL